MYTSVRGYLKARRLDYGRVRDLTKAMAICTSDSFWVDPDYDVRAKGAHAALAHTRQVISVLERILGVHQHLRMSGGIVAEAYDMTQHIAVTRALRAEHVTAEFISSLIESGRRAA